MDFDEEKSYICRFIYYSAEWARENMSGHIAGLRTCKSAKRNGFLEMLKYIEQQLGQS
jgi:hypothetical protein